MNTTPVSPGKFCWTSVMLWYLNRFLETLSSSLQASWQTIFWILVNLSIGAMAQPSGSICGFPSRYRTYLRCSPLICGADMLSIVIRLQVTVVYLRLSILESVGILLHNRFDINDHTNGERSQSFAPQAEDDDGGGDGIQVLERMTWLRWLWFLFGTLPPTIKLVSMSGVGWAQTWGMMFLGSWVINELLIVFATLNQSFFTISSSGRISWPGFEQTTRSAKYQHVQRYLGYCEKSLGIAALTIHVVLVNNIFRISLPLLDNTYPLSAEVMSDKYVSAAYTAIVSVTIFPAGLILSLLQYQYNVVVVSIGLFYIMLGNTATNSLVFEMVIFGASRSYSSVYAWAMSTIMTSVVLLFIRFLSQRFIMIGRNLLVLYRNATEGQFSIDYKACLALVFFLNTIVASLFWYSNIYNSSNTSMPVWTGVFG
jgi:hypothetical protein